MATVKTDRSNSGASSSPQRNRRIVVSLWLMAAGVLLLMGTIGGTSAWRRIKAVREIERLNGSIQYLHLRGPQWLHQWIGDERMVWFDDPDHVAFWADEKNMSLRSRFGGIVLTLDGPVIDDEGLACVLGLPQLMSLDLAFSEISDAGVGKLVDLRYLESLRLEGTDVSDASIPVLSQMRGLKELNVENTKLTNSGSRALEAALPGCKLRGPHNDRYIFE